MFANTLDEPKKLSKLAALAQKRRGANAVPDNVKEPADATGFNSNTKKPSKLAALASSRGTKNIATTSSNSDSLRQTGGASKLASLAKAKAGLNEVAGILKSPLLRPSNNTPILRKKLTRNPAELPADSAVPKREDVPDNAPKGHKRPAQEHHIVQFELLVQKSGLLASPENSMSIYLCETPGLKLHEFVEVKNKQRKLSHHIFNAYTNFEPNIAKVKSNFSQPSPDDKVLKAQEQAFEGVKDMSLDSKPKKTNVEHKPATFESTKPFKAVDIQHELNTNSIFSKPSESFVIIGHVDAGKSTLMGRILFETGTVDAKTVNKLVREAEKSGKGSFALAWIMDQTSEERSRGVTIDICATSFETPSTRFTAIDAPGHRDFVPQMISGVSQADVALLVVDSISGEFEAGFLMDGQTKEHTILAKNLGIEHVCVAVNKLDKENWSHSRFQEIQEQLLEFLSGEDVGFSPSNISFIPISGLTGQNVVKNNPIEEFKWYNGPTLLGCLESINMKGKQTLEGLYERDFNLAINDIHQVSNSEFRVGGKISLGLIQPGQTVELQPSQDKVQVQSVLIDDSPVDFGLEGQIVLLGFKLAQLKNKSTDDLSIGDLAVSLKTSVRSSKLFQATINTFNMNKPLLVGTPFVLFRNNASIGARINKVLKINGAKKKKMHLVSKQNAEVVIETLDERALPVSRFEDNKALGRIVIRREGATIGAGLVDKIL